MMQPGMNTMMASEMGNMNMGPQMMDPMMAGMGGEMGMDGVGVGVGVGVGAPQQGQGGPMSDQMGAGVEGFGPQGAMGMGMSEYGMQVRLPLHDRATREVQRGGTLGPERDATDAAATTATTATTTTTTSATANAAAAAPATATTTHVSKYGGSRRTVAARGSISRHPSGAFPRPTGDDDARWTGRVRASRKR